jgi:segregation and condensation protein A
VQKDTFEIKLPLFEGPFDLLLFFIERDELDIHDIPISGITHEFLGYIQQLNRLNIEVASEFILVAATLMQIKARLLLPRTVKDDQGNEIDPREDLIRHLLEYKKYKTVVAEMAILEMTRLQKTDRGNVAAELETLAQKQGSESELQDLNLYRLLRVFQKVMKRYEIDSQKITHTVVQYPFTMEEQKLYVLERLSRQLKLSFLEILEDSHSRLGLVYNFLAVLELLQSGDIVLQLGLGYNNFWIEKGVMNYEL